MLSYHQGINQEEHLMAISSLVREILEEDLEMLVVDFLMEFMACNICEDE